jgi:hypothetical protein
MSTTVLEEFYDNMGEISKMHILAKFERLQKLDLRLFGAIIAHSETGATIKFNSSVED